MRYIKFLFVSIKFLSNKLCMVFGCTGQDGSLACYSLLKKGYTVLGISRSVQPNYQYLKKLGIDRSFEIQQLKGRMFILTAFNLSEIFFMVVRCNTDGGFPHQRVPFHTK